MKRAVLPKRVVGITKAAQYAGVSRWTVRRWINNGQLPCVVFPGRDKNQELRGVKVDLRDLDAFIDRYKDRTS